VLGPNILFITISSRHSQFVFFPESRRQISHSYKATDKAVFLDGKQEDRRLWTEWWKYSPNLICS
jgi:hypothetical protein